MRRKYKIRDFCEICGSKDSRLVRDHNHKTGKIRGTLCEDCNGRLGALENGLGKQGVPYLTWLGKYMTKIDEYLKRPETKFWYSQSVMRKFRSGSNLLGSPGEDPKAYPDAAPKTVLTIDRPSSSGEDKTQAQLAQRASRIARARGSGVVFCGDLI